MKLGLVGLGKMGLNLAYNLLDHGHEVAAFDVNTGAVMQASQAGAQGAASLKELVEALEAPRIVWLMVPAGELTEKVTRELAPLLSSGDIILDGGNSHYKDSIRRAGELRERGIFFLDVGTSGGTEGARHGICAMVGGDKEAFGRVEPLFRDLSVENGWLYAGESGSGHFLKMIHNGIEYGMMQSIAEGFELLDKSPFGFDFEKVARVWNHGSVIRSWLMELTERAFSKDSDLSGLKGVAHSSGEGRWTVETALDYGAAAPVITLSLMMRYRSQEEDTFSGKVVAALRNEFGGHAVVRSEE
ncbi:phosphogluconate dehydrogenase (NAD(+)-dependent, decarboxylating) [Paenibacillus mucilaginosus]|uniref:YqeC n=2 Tax=Paenibacillus mucilaginosus TaxID=61624 RepID=H6NTT0_9BACL|nr:decarboxylating 6-phosphogluconate dehydrogenase [Paenibacillus mucilaginosus]AEI39404.1 YqeC [Paenibacillus mucilaginosus KNP414]AFC27674.1 YqeC [Paenibacillus mucilaginosus 3016]MCG7214757.1 decarboxylating 6-phosphogluconate dehydrogenase [Paenibacillus mucilaginosus]WDM28385.1 decarboxylating 6-phosphogluconate dehydrogenase [Paenibacillus mucilaginosus]WFA16557.1 decarboxylating 6-phosphogluconate dehydrogenase [Paenibacillus mucilaginosus]